MMSDLMMRGFQELRELARFVPWYLWIIVGPLFLLAGLFLLFWGVVMFLGGGPIFLGIIGLIGAALHSLIALIIRKPVPPPEPAEALWGDFAVLPEAQRLELQASLNASEPETLWEGFEVLPERERTPIEFGKILGEPFEELLKR